MSTLQSSKQPPLIGVLAVLVMVGLGALALTILTGGTGDYSMYLDQWHAQAETGNPWPQEFRGEPIPPNAYGPIHALFGMGFQISWILPKLAITGAIWLLFAVLVWDSYRQGNLTWTKVAIGLVIVPLSPLVAFSTYVQGMNDTIPALCLGLACLCRRERWFLLAGLLLGIGALMKFYPLLFAPFLALDKDRTLRFGLLFVAAGTFLLGMLAAYGIWGDAVLSPFTFGAERGAKALSFAELLESSVCAWGMADVCSITTDKNMYLVVFVASALALAAWAGDWDWEPAILVAVPVIFFTYKVGHNQFLQCWMAVLLYVAMQKTTPLRTRILWASVPMLVYLSLMKTGYILTGGLRGEGWTGDTMWVREWMGLPWLVLLGLFIWSIRDALPRPQMRMPRFAF